MLHAAAAMGPSCFSVALMLATWSLPDLVFPPTWAVDIPLIANISHIHCRGGDAGSTQLVYNSATFALSTTKETYLECFANFTAANDPGELTLELVVPPLSIEMDLTRGTSNATQCEVSAVAFSQCNVNPQLTNLTVEPASLNWLWNSIFTGVEKVINENAHNLTCGVLNDTLVPQLLNHTDVAPLTAPRITPGLTDVGSAPIVNTLLNIVQGLPVLLDTLVVKASVTSPTSLNAQLEIIRDMSPHVPFGASDLNLTLPAGATLSLDVWLMDFICTQSFSCSVARENGVQIQNVRLRGVGEVNRVVDNLIGPAIADVLSAVVVGIVNVSLSYTSHDGYEFANIELKEAELNQQPPFALGLGLAAFFSGLSIAVIGYSASRHTHHPVIGPDGTPISLRRVMTEDSFVVLTSFFTMCLFAWSNSTQAAAVMIGQNYRMYTFSLATTIQDLYDAELYALCVFITLFCGIYPYFKLLSIVLFSVVLQNPQSKVLMFIDTCGKFSLLDTFMMLIMVGGLEVPGIATVTMHSSFYVFLVASFLSILVGNYATHGWRKESRGSGPGTPLRTMLKEGSIEVFPASRTSRLDGDAVERTSDDDVEAKTPTHLRRWRGLVAVPATAVILAGSLVAGYEVSFTYNLSGIGTIVTGTEKKFTLFDLLNNSTWPIYGTGLFTVIIAPVLYAAGFPKSHVLGAWCATDTLLLACVAGLLQLTQFVKFVMGPVLTPVYTASATLGLPLLGLFASMLVQWVLLASEIFHVDLSIEGLRHLGSRIKARRLKSSTATLQSTVSLKEETLATAVNSSANRRVGGDYKTLID